MSEAKQAAQTHEAFEWVGATPIDSLKLCVEHYRHKKTGAHHYHLAHKHKENVFLVALKTVPTDSTGVAHILEHTVLCGSEKYPVRDPFFMMIRRSLNTFMNAFTSSDWTAYPFASQNRKDFDNLLSVYLDAVFFSRLDPLDFAQEGHRLEFATADDPSTPLVYKGVVYNEMKGAMSSATSQLWQGLTKHLFPTTTYHYNSGGEPDHIPDLTYDQLMAFYRKHYHPSNAVFMTFGDIPAHDHHEKFDSLVLSRFDALDRTVTVPDEKRYFAPVQVHEHYPLPEDEPAQHKTHHVISWLLGPSTDLQGFLEAHLLANVLLENSASPLMKALEQTNLGKSPSPLCGLEDSNKEMSFTCGLEASDPEHAEALEALVMSVLADVAEQGVEPERVEAVLHQLELSQREITGDGFPYGLQLILTGLSAAVHGADPTRLLDMEPALAQLRENIKDPAYIKGLVLRLLLDNPHRVRLTLSPDQQFEPRRQAATEAKLAAIKQTLGDTQKQHIVSQAQALEARQIKKDDESLLPKVGLDDVPAELPRIEPEQVQTDAGAVTYYKRGTNGLVYQQVVLDLPELEPELIQVLPLYSYCLPEFGLGQQDYLAVQDRQSSVSGGISVFSSMKGRIDDEQDISAHLVFSGKALSRNSRALSELLVDTFQQVRFDELERLRELVAQIRARREQSVTGNGHGLAMGAASSRMSPTAHLSYQLNGLLGIRRLKALDDSLDSADALADLAAQLAAIHQRILTAPRQFLLVGEKADRARLIDDVSAVWPQAMGSSAARFQLSGVREQTREAWIAPSQVNFCAKAYPTVAVDHADAAPLSVLGGYLRNGFLHRAIREHGGAYGGGAAQDSGIAAFRFFSYRDPRLADTLDDFDRAIDWFLSEPHDEQSLEEAILGVVGQLDKPKSPAGDAKSHFHSALYGRDNDQRMRFRRQVLAVTEDDLKRVAVQYLSDPAKASVAVLTNSEHQDEVDGLGLAVSHL